MASESKTDKDWKEKLTPEQYHVLRQKGTEPPGSGKYVKKTSDGMYHCAACGAVLFSSEAQFESTEPGLRGWPSFERVENLENIELRPDNSLGAQRTEVLCKKCGSHLGHVFDAADSKTGKHFCINSCALELKKK
ncbi:peptide-methionine (R)-S-oxide reductase MsrB [Candidatus Uhrbacteria bacterium]|nr:peptide-methionine (R)-S-oxide reductase MsrB [Candidatus Uhrbacteria bacterium]